MLYISKAVEQETRKKKKILFCF